MTNPTDNSPLLELADDKPFAEEFPHLAGLLFWLRDFAFVLGIAVLVMLLCRLFGLQQFLSGWLSALAWSSAWNHLKARAQSEKRP